MESIIINYVETVYPPSSPFEQDGCSTVASLVPLKTQYEIEELLACSDLNLTCLWCGDPAVCLGGGTAWCSDACIVEFGQMHEVDLDEIAAQMCREHQARCAARRKPRLLPRQDISSKARIKGDGYTYTESEACNRIFFTIDPLAPEYTRMSVRQVLKEHGFKWSNSRMAWVRMRNRAGILDAALVREQIERLTFSTSK